MKLNSDDIERILKYEQKRGIKYAKQGGKLYNRLFAAGFVTWIYMMLMTLFYILGMSLSLSEDSNIITNVFVTILLCFIVEFASAFIYKFVSKLAGIIINIIAVPVHTAAFIRICLVNASYSSSTVTEYDPGILGVKTMFYWRHGIPALAVFAVAVILAVIIIRERIIVKKEYTTIANNSYISEIVVDNE